MSELGKKYGLYTVDWAYILFITSAISMFIWVFLLSGVGGLPSANPQLYTIIVILVYILIVFTLIFRRPRIVLYEEGVHVFEDEKETVWRWEQLTHFKGQRTTYSGNAIPLLKYGSNDFYSAEEMVFSVGALTASADTLVNFILTKMAENKASELRKILATGKSISINGILVTEQGIGDTSNLYSWDSIEKIMFRSDVNWFGNSGDVLVKIKKQRKWVTLGRVFSMSRYMLMSLTDYYKDTNVLSRIQRKNIIWWRRWFTTGAGWTSIISIMLGVFLLMFPTSV